MKKCFMRIKNKLGEQLDISLKDGEVVAEGNLSPEEAFKIASKQLTMELPDGTASATLVYIYQETGE